MQRRSSLSTIALAILACLLWSTAFAGIKIGLTYSEPLSFAGTRFMLSGLILMPFWITRVSVFRMIYEHFRSILILSFFQTFFFLRRNLNFSHSLE